MNNDEFYEYESRAYINPTLSSGEQETFIDNLRNIQSQNNAQIAQQTYNLGTDVPSNLGGLGGGEAYFTSRYQTPQVGEMTATLKSAAQAQALNDVMSNYQAQLKQRYNSAYRKAQQRARAAAARAASTGGTTSTKGSIKLNDPIKTGKSSITDVPVEGHNTTAFTVGGEVWVYDSTTGNYYVNGENRGPNPSVVSMKGQGPSSGGGAW